MTQTVIILHPDLEFSLINFQKKLIFDINSFFKSFNFAKNFFFYAVYPLWLPLNQNAFSSKNKDDLKKISKKIISVAFEDFPVYENDEINIRAKIKTAETEYFSKMTISKLYKNKIFDENQIKNKIENCILTKKTPFSAVKIFRLGICHKFSEHSQDITEAIWTKKNS